MIGFTASRAEREIFGVSSALVLSLVSACRGEHEQAVRAEAARILRAVETLRDAPNPGKAELLARLDHEACIDATVCELKSECVQAYSLHVSGLERTEAARLALKSDAGADQLAQAARLTRVADRELAQAKQRVERCAELSGALRRRIE